MAGGFSEETKPDRTKKVTERPKSWLSAKSTCSPCRRSRFWDQFPALTSGNPLLPVIPRPWESDALFRSLWVLHTHGTLVPCKQKSHTQKIKSRLKEWKAVHRSHTAEVPSHWLLLLCWTGVLVSLSSPGWPASFLTSLPQPPKCWNDRSQPPYLAHMLLRVRKPVADHISQNSDAFCSSPEYAGCFFQFCFF